MTSSWRLLLKNGKIYRPFYRSLTSQALNWDTFPISALKKAVWQRMSDSSETEEVAYVVIDPFLAFRFGISLAATIIEDDDTELAKQLDKAGVNDEWMRRLDLRPGREGYIQAELVFRTYVRCTSLP